MCVCVSEWCVCVSDVLVWVCVFILYFGAFLIKQLFHRWLDLFLSVYANKSNFWWKHFELDVASCIHSMIVPSDDERLKRIRCLMQCSTTFVCGVVCGQCCFMLKCLVNLASRGCTWTYALFQFKVYLHQCRDVSLSANAFHFIKNYIGSVELLLLCCHLPLFLVPL